MSTTDTDTRTKGHSDNIPTQEPHSQSGQHKAGISPRTPARSHHRGTNPSTRRPLSQEQRQKLSAAQKAYVATDPRWHTHRRKLADAQIARRMTLTEEELDMVVKMRAKGRTFSYIAEDIGVCHDVIRRTLAECGHPTARIRKERRAKRGTGHWRSFD